MGICNSSTKEDVRKDRERTRPNDQRAAQHQQQQQGGQQQQQAASSSGGVGDRSRGPASSIPKPAPGASQGIPVGSYRDASGRSVAADKPIAASYRGSGVDDGMGGGGGGAYGTSYTNRKTKEYNLLNDIVKQTRSNFIDVSAKSGALDEDDLLERGQKYVKNLSEIPSALHQSAPSATAHSFGVYYSALDLPHPSCLVVKRTPVAASSSSLTSGIAQAKATGEVDYAALVAILASAAINAHDAELITAASAQAASVIIEATTVQQEQPRIVLTYEELLAQ